MTAQGRRGRRVMLVATLALVLCALAGAHGEERGEVVQEEVHTGGHGSAEDAAFAREASKLVITNATPDQADEAQAARAAAADVDDETHRTFVPTREWKRVGRNQAIPEGLHVRMDLSTGIRMAKLLEHDTEEESKVSPLVGSALAQVRPSTITDVDEYLKRTVERQVWKRYPFVVEWLRTIVRGLAENTPPSCTEALDRLDDLSGFIDDIDHAHDLAKGGGLGVVYLALSGDTCGPDAVAAGGLVLGSAMQNNPFVQDTAVGDGVTQLLLRLLRPVLSDHPQRGAGKDTVRAMYALGALLRHSEAGQAVFEQEQGWALLRAPLLTLSEAAASPPDHTQVGLLRKLVALIFDLSMEHGAEPLLARMAPGQSDRQGICRSLASLITRPVFDDQDLTEDAVNCLVSLADPCAPLIPAAEVRKVLASKFDVSRVPASIEYDSIDDSAAFLHHKLSVEQ